MTPLSGFLFSVWLLVSVSAQEDDTDDSHDDIPYATIHPPATVSSDSVENHHRFTAFISSQSGNFTTLQCRNYKDFYRLLYTMCYDSVLCSERYSLERTTTTTTGGKYAATVTRENFKKFVYRLSLRQLFIIQDSGRNTSGTPPPLFLLEDKVPLEWIPRYIIQLTHRVETSCADTFDTLAVENVGFVHATHYQLHLYSAYVRNDYECRHVNEWLTLDSHNRPYCECRQGKSCNNEGNYEVVIIVLTVFIILLLIIDTVAFFTNTTRVFARLDKINRTTTAKPKQQ